MITADQFRKQYAKGGDDRTKKKTTPPKVETNTGQKIKLVIIKLGDITHYIPEDRKEIIANYKSSGKDEKYKNAKRSVQPGQQE